MPTDITGAVESLALYESKSLFGITTFAPGTYIKKLQVAGNSILSTAYVESLDLGASVQINYYESDSGEDSVPPERVELAQHIPISTAQTSDKITVARLHNKPVIEIIVTGGNVHLGVYITVVASFVTDLDQALQLDGSPVDLNKSKGMPTMLYDATAGKFFFLRGEGGTLPISISESGDPVHLTAQTVSTPGTAQDLITDTVPIGKTRKLNQAVVTSSFQGTYIITLDGDIIGSGRTGPSQKNSIFSWNPRKPALSGQELKLTFTAISGIPASDVEAYLMGSDI